MNSHDQQFESSKERYLEQKYPGDLTNVLPAIKEQKQPLPDPRYSNDKLVAIAITVLFALMTSVALLWLVTAKPGRGETAKQNQKKHRVKLVHLSRPVSFSPTFRRQKSVIEIGQPRSKKTLWSARFKKKTKSSKTKNRKNKKTFWLSWKDKSKPKTKSKLTSKKKRSLLEKSKFLDDYRFQPIRILNYRKT